MKLNKSRTFFLNIVPTLMLALFIVISIFFGFTSCSKHPAAKLKFEQLDFELDGETIVNSAWGSVDLTYAGISDIQYFNLAVNNKHVLKNIPVLCVIGQSVNQPVTIRFDLGIHEGIEVDELEYAFSLSTNIIDSMPDNFQKAPVLDGKIIFNSGLIGVPKKVPKLDLPPPQIEGGPVYTVAFHGVDFPNQDCGLNECLPAAVSNSLKFLNKKYNLKIPEDKLSIDAMKDATNWHGEGGHGKIGWENRKDEFMRKSLNNYKIETKKITDFNEIIEEIRKGHDVELMLDQHAVVVIGIAKLRNGKFWIEYVHDVKQGKKDGTVTEIIIYDPQTGLFEGGAHMHASKFRYFVSEMIYSERERSEGEK